MPLSHQNRLGLGLCLVSLIAACVVPMDDDDAELVGELESGLTAVASFGSNPGALKMYYYSPAGVPSSAPLVVALHGCTQTATDYEKAGWNQLADLWKFHVVYPEQQTANNSNRCFNWFESGDIGRGAGEALSIKQMVDYMKTNKGVDPARVFVTGLSAGGAMTTVMLSTYPDVFAGGAIMAGLPYRCAIGTSQAFSCMNPGVDKTPAAWGDLVRNAYSGYAGPYPRVSVWHGTTDTTVKPMNMTEIVDQWANVHGIDTTADATTTVGGATRKEFRNAAGLTLVESWSIPNMGHGTAVDPGFAAANGCGTAGAYILDVNLCSTYHAGTYFGLNAGSGGTSSSSSSTSVSSSASSGSGGAGGTGGAGGSGGSGGSTYTCQDYYDSNYNHVTVGRAVRCGVGGSYTCAVGSNNNLGLWNTMQTWVRQTAPGYYEAGQCP